jgi:hypothetical protein
MPETPMRHLPTTIEFLECVDPQSVNEENYSFKVHSSQYTPVYGSIGVIDIDASFNLQNTRWASRKENNNLPMPRPGAVVTVEGFLAGFAHDGSKDENLTELHVSIEAIYFPTSIRAPIAKALGTSSSIMTHSVTLC